MNKLFSITVISIVLSLGGTLDIYAQHRQWYNEQIILPYSRDTSNIQFLLSKKKYSKRQTIILKQSKKILFFLDSIFYSKQIKHAHSSFLIPIGLDNETINIKYIKNKNELTSLNGKIDEYLLSNIINIWFNSHIQPVNSELVNYSKKYLPYLLSEIFTYGTPHEIYGLDIVYRMMKLSKEFYYRDILGMHNFIQAVGGSQSFYPLLFNKDLNSTKFDSLFLNNLNNVVGYDLKPAYKYLMEVQPIPILNIKLVRNDNLLQYNWKDVPQNFRFPLNIVFNNYDSKTLIGEGKMNSVSINNDSSSIQFMDINNNPFDVVKSDLKYKVFYFLIIDE